MPFGIDVLDARHAAGGLRASAEVVPQACTLVDDAAATLFLNGIAARETVNSQ